MFKVIALAVALVMSASAIASPSGGGEGGDKVHAKMMAANEAAIARQK